MKTGLIIGRFQPLHNGHCAVINRMIGEYDTVIVGMGSPNKSREAHDPYTIEERMQMLRSVYADRLRLIPLADIGAVNPSDWCAYVLRKIVGAGLPEPTDYHAGSEADALWYRDHFYQGDTYGLRQRIAEGKVKYEHDVARNAPKNVLAYYESLTRYVLPSGIVRTLHVMGRDNNPWPSATEVRQFIQLGSPHWHKYVPAVNHEIVFNGYPDELRVPEARAYREAN